MTKEALNRLFGDPERQKPITPPDLLVAAHLIQEHCNSINICMNCIFHDDRAHSCSLFEVMPLEWKLSDAEHKTRHWIDKQYFHDRSLYLDTDKER